MAREVTFIRFSLSGLWPIVRSSKALSICKASAFGKTNRGDKCTDKDIEQKRLFALDTEG